ncbi:Molybdenum cofactor sulfurase [Liparis tanakae]|uniref:Molybdenum cofactor sulfurase n=1 Tax=Liparis tanakae TaxID=230148 RepID=A0A4Z2FUM6_9TELE|nr:Molybdenum cofactor sulfurase [Liparis tanakae]
MSTFRDCQKFLSFVAECFVDKPVTVDRARLGRLAGGAEPRGGDRDEPPEDAAPRGTGDEGAGPAEASPRGVGRRASSGHKEAYTLTNIYIYPVKSCAAFEVQDWPLGPLGLLHDRGWMVVNGNGVCLSQKRETRLCLVRPRVLLPSNELLLQAPGMETLSVPLEDETLGSDRVCQSKVCGDRVQAVDCGGAAASWLSHFLGQPCRLIRQSPDSIRDMKKRPSGAATSSPLSLVNEAQYLLISRASVELLLTLTGSSQGGAAAERLLDTQNAIGRFRANLVIAGGEAFEEDGRSHFVIGDTRFAVAGQCGRCQMIGVDQETGAKTKEPLTSLSAYREGKVTFGVYLTHEPPEGPGHAVRVLSAGSAVQPEPRGS